jgi:phenylpropionate dioxygenase-like ring-hydroxylating dioxygenase large terminal subunit
MFDGFARVWTPVALSGELGPSTPLGVQVAGTPIVLFRQQDGRPAALVDRCPHRGVALSLGKVKDGCVACPFHGWRLDAEGQVRQVPWNPDAKLATLRGTPLAARELAGQIWVYTPLTAATTEPEVNPILLQPGLRISGFRVTWKAHWTRAMENMLDWPHLPFVHRATIGKSMARQTDARLDVTMDEQPWGMSTKILIDGQPQPGSLDLRWPNQMNLHIGVPRRTLIMLVACVPVDREHTVMLLTMARSFLTSRLFDPFFHRANARIAAEDRAIVESSFPVEVPPAGQERSVRTDAPTLAFRRRYFAELHGSSAELRGPTAESHEPSAAPTGG